MTEPTQRYFLFIGTSNTETAVSKLKASGIYYRQKKMESRPENWELIVEILKDSNLAGVVGKLTAQVYRMIVQPSYEGIAVRLFQALARKPHVLFVHEAVLAGDSSPAEPPLNDHSEYDDEYDDESYVSFLLRHEMKAPDADTRSAVNSLLDNARVNVVPYRRNAELSVLASAFIDDNEKSLLFRVYVPSGRLYAAEADKLLNLFRDWLSQVGRHGIRQDGYSTAAGQVYEFFGNDSLPASSLSHHFDDFADFLTKCLQDPGAAEEGLHQAGLDRRVVPALVQKYGKEARRLQVDLRHERERRMLAIRQQLESELPEIAEHGQSLEQIDNFVQQLLPAPSGFAPQGLLLPAMPYSPSGINVNINQQVVTAAESTVIQYTQGTVHLGFEAKALLDLAERHGEQSAADLESAVHELEDVDARPAERLEAKQRLKGFLFKIAEHIGPAMLSTLQKYIEAKVGV